MIKPNANKPRTRKQISFKNKHFTELTTIMKSILTIVNKDDPHKIHKLLAYELSWIFNTVLSVEVLFRYDEELTRRVMEN